MVSFRFETVHSMRIAETIGPQSAVSPGPPAQGRANYAYTRDR